MEGLDFTDYYVLLGVDGFKDDPNFQKIVNKNYRELAITTHPDKGGDEEKFKELNAAKETLTDIQKRETYDQKLNELNVENEIVDKDIKDKLDENKDGKIDEDEVYEAQFDSKLVGEIEQQNPALFLNIVEQKVKVLRERTPNVYLDKQLEQVKLVQQSIANYGEDLNIFTLF